MHIGIITGEYPPMEGGVGDYTREISNALREAGHLVHILTTTSRTHPELVSQEFISRGIHHWSMLQAYPVIQRWLREIKPDIVNIQYQAAAYQMKGVMNFLPKWLSFRNGPPVVITYHDLLPPYLFPKAGVIREWSVKFMAQNAAGAILTNESDRFQLSKAIGSTSTRIKVIPIGSNIPSQPPADYAPHTWRSKFDIRDKDLLLGFFGFMNRSKGVDLLVRASANLHKQGYPVKLIFIGGRTGTSDITNSEYADYIDAYIEEHGISHLVRRTGFVSPQEVSASLLSVDICALPYLEGASLRHGTLHAALTHGCAIVTTMSSQVNPRLEGAVCLISSNDVAALQNAIINLWEDSTQRLTLQKKAKKLSESFCWDNIALETASFFQECLS